MRNQMACAVVLFLLSFAVGSLAAESAMDAKIKASAERAADKGIGYLKDHQAANGSWSDSVGITALVLQGALGDHGKYTESHSAFISRAIQFILSRAKPDGSISESMQNMNYNTATAITALAATGNSKYEDVINRAKEYLKKVQITEEGGFTKDYKYYGGVGYGKDNRADLANQYIAMEALKAAHVDPKDPVWEKALVFIRRCQNWSETNDQKWAANDGGFIYTPGFSPYGGTRSYGGMTSAGLVSLLFAGLDKKDPAIQAAYHWISENYTLDSNPGVNGDQGLFFYYSAFSKAMYAYGEPVVVDGKGVRHLWRNELATKLLSLQDKDGSWINENSDKWWEGDRNLVTAWSVIALDLCTRD